MRRIEQAQIGPAPGTSERSKHGYQPSQEMLDMEERAAAKIEYDLQRYEILIELGKRWDDPPVDKHERPRRPR